MGFWAAMIPSASPLFWLIFFALFFIKINQAMALLSLLLASGAAILLDPVLHQIGFYLLTADNLFPVWNNLYQIPLVPLTRFNNTVVMGGLITGLAAFPVLFFAVQAIIIPIRTKLVPKIAASKLAQKLYTSPKIAKLIAGFRRWSELYQTVRE